MELDQVLEEIKDINLSYLLLTTKMLREDTVSAMLRLGINPDVADILGKLTSSQLLNMATSNMLLCRFHFDDRMIAEMLSNNTREQTGITNDRDEREMTRTENLNITVTKY